MARHDQRPDDRLMVCKNCKDGNCSACVDVLRAAYADDLICRCTRRNHMGEPVDQQIKDPETGTVYGPGLSVSELGEIARDERKREEFLRLFSDGLSQD